MTHQERLLIQEGLLSRCNRILVEKVDAIELGLPNTYFEREDNNLKDLAIKLLQTIPHEEENFTMMPEINLGRFSNCKAICDIKVNVPMSVDEVAALIDLNRQNDIY